MSYSLKLTLMSHQWTMSRCPEPRTPGSRGPSAPAEPGSAVPGSAVPAPRGTAHQRNPRHPGGPRHPCGTRRSRCACRIRYAGAAVGRWAAVPVRQQRRPVGGAVPTPATLTMPQYPPGRADSLPAPHSCPCAHSRPAPPYPGGPSVPGRPTPPATYLRHLRGAGDRHLRGAGQHPGELGALRLGKSACRVRETRQAPRAAVANESPARPSATIAGPHSRQNVPRRRRGHGPIPADAKVRPGQPNAGRAKSWPRASAREYVFSVARNSPRPWFAQVTLASAGSQRSLF
jgi:hypothetical protein